MITYVNKVHFDGFDLRTINISKGKILQVKVERRRVYLCLTANPGDQSIGTLLISGM